MQIYQLKDFTNLKNLKIKYTCFKLQNIKITASKGTKEVENLLFSASLFKKSSIWLLFV